MAEGSTSYLNADPKTPRKRFHAALERGSGGIKCPVVDPGQADGTDRLNANGLGALPTVMIAMTVKDL